MHEHALVYLGLIFSGVCLVAYLVAAMYRHRTPELADAIEIVISAIGVVGAVKIFGFVFSDGFSGLCQSPMNTGTFRIADEDAVFFLVGALALAWISLVTIARCFGHLAVAVAPVVPPVR